MQVGGPRNFLHALKKTVISIASEQAKAAKINTAVFIQKTTCIVVEKNLIPQKVVHEPDQPDQ